MKTQKQKLASTHLSHQTSCDGPNVTTYNQNIPCKQQQSTNLTKSIRKIAYWYYVCLQDSLCFFLNRRIIERS
jgi:hypothetical protein